MSSWYHCALLGLTLFILLDAPARAEDKVFKGKLPHGTPSATPQPSPSGAPVTAPATSTNSSPSPTALDKSARAPSAEELDCFTYMSSPVNPRVSVNKTGIYYLSRVESLGSKQGIEAFRYELLKVNLSRDKAGKILTKNALSKLFSFEGPASVGLIVHDTPPTGYTILSFSGLEDGCAQGEAVGVTIPFSSTQSRQLPPSKSVAKGHYSLVDSDNGRFYADFSKGLIKSVDPQNGQQRTVYQAEKHTIPLFWSTEKKMAYLWQVAPEPKLYRRGSVASIKLGELALKRGERLVQDHDRFGIIHVNVSDNTLGIAELNQWSTLGPSLLHVLNLPKGLLANEANILVNFANAHAVVYGGSPKTKDSWSNLYIYKLKEGLAADLTWSSTDRLSSVVFGPKQDIIVVFLEKGGSGLYASARVYDLATRKWTTF